MPDDSPPFLTVITRTLGARATLVDTLTSLAAQADGDFEVRLMLNPDAGAVRRRQGRLRGQLRRR